ncbi:MAG: peptidoglycan DD-metalloendopeptidase family protein [Gammaproteobacteria bacterium]|nr:peptidoglycan DD-metalloendopeptidase family protein [Gammaproteobacteria bacterium]MCW9004076.1 peptidoglycan DD-metalloendopeptidase family protein [Gammaproteobacteria bacterium]MCW9056088.1 peptidoglycan DD-metalloendopeptidase family protein [Gammaproteobacteria bacterium]
MNYNRYINKDFQKLPQPERHPALRWLAFSISCVILSVVIANTKTPNEQSKQAIETNHNLDAAIETLQSSTDSNDINSFKLELPNPVINSSLEPTDNENGDFSAERNWQTLTVKPGYSLSVLFDKAQIKPNQLLELMSLGKETKRLTRLHPGNKIQVETTEDGELLALHYDIDEERYLRVIRQEEGLIAKTLTHDIETRLAHASGVIDSSLFLASQKAGLSQNLTMELAAIFGWDIDFVLDIRQGDQFTLIYEELFKDGEKIKDGNILAAEFINDGKSHKALRYVNPTTNTAGYYSEDGQSLRKAFLRSPVNFSRISSKFTTKRYHPLLHKFRSHKGVDYAAARGTPIKASGEGKVIFKGRKGGYGKVIIIKHGSRYSTLYAHLSNFNRKVRIGSRVNQGQVIGYVGSTGLASGPHLHYEFRVNGVHRNPLTVKFPGTKPIPERHKDNFELTTQSYLAQLNVLSRNNIALNDN